MSSRWPIRTTLRAVTFVLACLLCLGAAEIPALAARAAQKEAQAPSQLLTLMNRARDRRGLHPLRMDKGLCREVHRHSAQMARKKRLFHSRNVGRYLRGRHWRQWGENIGEVSGSMARLEHLFLHSAPHRKNILNPGFHDAGVGVVQARGKNWVTVVFYG